MASDYIKMIDETSSIHEAWAELFVGDHKTKNSDEVEKCLYNIMVVTLCMHAEENHRPTTALVRRARKFLVQGLKATSPAVQSLSKMMAATRASQVVLETSRKYASMGVEDDAATRMFGISCKKFEEKFAVAFSDIELFINETDDSTIMNFECLVERLKPLCDVLIVSAQSIPRCGDQQPVNTRTNKSLYKKHLRGTSQLTHNTKTFFVFRMGLGWLIVPDRWSNAGLTENAEQVMVAIGNCVELFSCGLYGMISTFHKHLTQPLHGLLERLMSKCYGIPQGLEGMTLPPRAALVDGETPAEAAADDRHGPFPLPAPQLTSKDDGEQSNEQAQEVIMKEIRSEC